MLLLDKRPAATGIEILNTAGLCLTVIDFGAGLPLGLLHGNLRPAGQSFRNVVHCGDILQNQLNLDVVFSGKIHGFPEILPNQIFVIGEREERGIWFVGHDQIAALQLFGEGFFFTPGAAGDFPNVGNLEYQLQTVVQPVAASVIDAVEIACHYRVQSEKR